MCHSLFNPLRANILESLVWPGRGATGLWSIGSLFIYLFICGLIASGKILGIANLWHMIMPKPSAGHSFHCPQVTVIWCEIRTVKEDLLVLHLVQDSCKIGYA